MKKFIWTTLLLCHFLIGAQANDTIFVNALATGLNNGTSWVNAYTKVHNAIMQAQSGDEIWVAKGNYYLAESRVHPRLSFPSNVRMYGNFDGNENSIHDRNLNIILTRFARGGALSQDSLNYYASGLTFYLTGPGTLLNGISFSTGYSWPYDVNTGTVLGCLDIECYGGAIQVVALANTDTTNVSIEHCVFDSCQSAGGSAIYGLPSHGKVAIRILNCQFLQNLECSVEVVGVEGNLDLNIDSSVFFNNRSMAPGIRATDVRVLMNGMQQSNLVHFSEVLFEGAIGANPWFKYPVGILAKGNIEIDKCSFINNISTSTNRLLFGSLTGSVGNFSITQSRFINCMSYGGIVGLTDCSSRIENCLFAKCEQSLSPNAGIYGIISTTRNPFFPDTVAHITTVRNCTFVDNSFGSSALINTRTNFNSSLNLFVDNCIFSKNKTGGILDTILSITSENGGVLSFNNNLVDYADSLLFLRAGVKFTFTNPNVLNIGSANEYNQIPLFVKSDSLDFRLLGCSPGVNRGENNMVNSLFDLNGFPRIMDGVVDMGAYESNPVSYSINTIEPKCFNGSDGQLQVVTTGGSGSLAYNWGTGDSSYLLTGVNAGLYDFTITEGGICKTVGNSLVSQPDSQTLSVVFIQASTSVSQDGGIIVTPNGGTEPFEYFWSNGNLTSSNAQIASGSYFLTLTDGNGCTSTYEFRLGTSGTQEPDFEAELEIYPNPAHLHVVSTVRLPIINTVKRFSVVISDVSGLIIDQYFVNSNNRTEVFDISALPSGLYFISLLSNGQVMKTEKLVILR